MRCEESVHSDTTEYDVKSLSGSFPILGRSVHGHRLIYYDNAATTQKPLSVLESMEAYYQRDNANVHRSVHALGQAATQQYEGARERIQKFIGAKRREEIIFTKGATEAINLVALSWSMGHLKKGEGIAVSVMEHHSNIVPWQWACARAGAKLYKIGMDGDGVIDVEAFSRLLKEKKGIRCVAFTHISNAIGTVQPIKALIDIAHASGAIVVVDGSQAPAHRRVNVQDIGADFYAFSAHKCYGPMGMGVLYGRYALLESMLPYQGGGEMIASVSFEKGTTYNDLPHRYEAGTPHVAGAIGMARAADFIDSVGIEAIEGHESKIHACMEEGLQSIEGVRILAPSRGGSVEKIAIISFVVEGVHVYDVGLWLDTVGIAVRVGHHCAQPLMETLGVEATIRISMACYNNIEEVHIFLKKVEEIVNKLR